MPTGIVNKGRVRPDDTTLIESMLAVIARLDWLEEKILGLIVLVDRERRQVIADTLTASSGPMLTTPLDLSPVDRLAAIFNRTRYAVV